MIAPSYASKDIVSAHSVPKSQACGQSSGFVSDATVMSRSHKVRQHPTHSFLPTQRSHTCISSRCYSKSKWGHYTEVDSWPAFCVHMTIVKQLGSNALCTLKLHFHSSFLVMEVVVKSTITQVLNLITNIRTRS